MERPPIPYDVAWELADRLNELRLAYTVAVDILCENNLGFQFTKRYEAAGLRTGVELRAVQAITKTLDIITKESK